MKIITKILLWMNSDFVDQDAFGNKYYLARKVNPYNKRKTRSVIYNGMDESSKVPAGWHAWLHYLSNEAPTKNTLKYSWQKGHLPNLTGTKHAYRPNDGVRVKVASDYHAWRPEN